MARNDKKLLYSQADFHYGGKKWSDRKEEWQSEVSAACKGFPNEPVITMNSHWCWCRCCLHRFS